MGEIFRAELAGSDDREARQRLSTVVAPVLVGRTTFMALVRKRAS